VALGEIIFGLSGPFSFYHLGLNVPEGAAAGCVVGAAIGYTCADLVLRLRNRRIPVPQVPDISQPEVSAGLSDLTASGIEGTASLKSAATRKHIEDALARLTNREHIQVQVRDQKVILRGRVHSWEEEAEAERIAFDMPGIQEVDNRIEVAIAPAARK